MNTIFKNLEPGLKGLRHISHQGLFFSCCLFIYVLPLIIDRTPWLSAVVMTLVVMFSLLALDKLTFRISFSGLLLIALRWLTKTNDLVVVGYLAEFAMVAFVLLMVVALIVQIMRVKEVHPINLLQAVNGYLLLGILFISFVAFIEKTMPGSFAGSNGPLAKTDLVYFCLITFTTTGFGDIVPQTILAKNIAISIAMSGQFYVAFIVAILVGKYANKKH